MEMPIAAQRCKGSDKRGERLWHRRILSLFSFLTVCLLLAFLINLVFFYSPTVFSFSIYRM